MAAAYMLADVIVYARADSTGFARVVGEAQAMGRPIVALTARCCASRWATGA